MIAELLGVGDADRADLRRWSDACIEGADEDDAERRRRTWRPWGSCSDSWSTTLRRGGDAPRDDLLSALVEAEVEGRAR